MRLSIEITTQQHQHLKAAAALQELEAFLQPRIEAAEKGDFSSKSVDDIFDEVIQEQSE
ncbi:MAG: antitoxin [Algicola sp.]|nr:antitoxin [Algicola sp.]